MHLIFLISYFRKTGCFCFNESIQNFHFCRKRWALEVDELSVMNPHLWNFFLYMTRQDVTRSLAYKLTIFSSHKNCHCFGGPHKKMTRHKSQVFHGPHFDSDSQVVTTLFFLHSAHLPKNALVHEIKT